MKKIIRITILSFTFGLMSISMNAQTSSSPKITVSNGSIQWKTELIDLGEIPQSKPKAIEYEFKNTGKTNVLITNVHGSCGCTTTDYTKDEILPGKTAKINATFNAANKGAFTKTVTVTTNADETPKVLTFKGIVI
jgi:hypothetical protein